MKKIRECEVCGHKGVDVTYQRNTYKAGYFCKNQEDCFERYKNLRNEVSSADRVMEE